MRRKTSLALLAALLFALAPGLGRAAHITLTAKGAEPGSAVLELATNKLVTMTPIPFRLRITDADGQAVKGAAVNCDMTMPSMKMPENRPKVAERNGYYIGELMFTCAQGAWLIRCEVVAQGQPGRTLSFEIEGVRMR